MRVSPDLVPVANKKTRWRGNAQMARECSKFFRVDSAELPSVPTKLSRQNKSSNKKATSKIVAFLVLRNVVIFKNTLF